MGVAGRHDAVGARAGRHGQHPGQRGPGRDRCVVAPAGRSGDEVEGPGDGGADAGPAGIGEGQRAHHAVEHVEVVDEGLGVGVDDDELGPVEPVQRPVAGGERRAHRRRRELRQHRVGRRFHHELDRARPVSDRHGLAAGVDALHRTTLGVAHEALALEARRVEAEAEVEQRLDTSTRPRRRDVTAEAERRRPPRRAPATTDLERRQVVERWPGLDGERQALGVDEGQDPLGDLPGDPLLDQLAVVVHRAILAAGQLTGCSQEAPRSGEDAVRMAPTTPHDHDDIFDRGLQFDMSTLLGRRRLLSVVAGAGAVAVLAACGADTGGSGATATTTGSTAGTTAGTTGATAGTSDRLPAARRSPRRPPGRIPVDGSNGPNVLAESGVVRSDIRSSFGSSTTVAEGVPLTIDADRPRHADGCAPLAGAAVYLWHCDRDGRYSMYSTASPTRTTCAACRRPTPTGG